MPRGKQISVEQIIAKLREAEVELARGKKVPEAAKKIGVTENNMAILDLDARRLAEAGDRLREAIVWQRQALVANPLHPQYRQFLTNHLTTLINACVGLNDATGAAEARRQLAELQATQPGFSEAHARLTAVLNGDPPKDNAERLALAQFAYHAGQFATSANLFAEALQTEPKLGESRQTQHRYNAACAAALAASGQGTDALNSDDANAKLRTQALTHLEAELEAWSRFLETASSDQRGSITETLKHWRNDSDLAGVRDPANLAKLPNTERETWSVFWASVDELLAKVAEKPGDAGTAEQRGSGLPW